MFRLRQEVTPAWCKEEVCNLYQELTTVLWKQEEHTNSIIPFLQNPPFLGSPNPSAIFLFFHHPFLVIFGEINPLVPLKKGEGGSNYVLRTKEVFNTTFTLEPTITDLKLIRISFKTRSNHIYLFPAVYTRL